VTGLLLTSAMYNSVDDYYYKLILATLCSKAGLGEEFEKILSVGYLELEELYRASNQQEPSSFIDVFQHYLVKTRKLQNAEVLIHGSYNKLFSMSVHDIMPELLETSHMERKVFEILKRELLVKFSDSDWQSIKADVYSFLKQNIRLTDKFCGEASSFFGLVRTTIQFYIKGNKADIFSQINKSGMNVVDENEFSSSLLNIETLSVDEGYAIDFQATLKAISKLNDRLYSYMENNTTRIFIYDVLSYYKRPLLEYHYENLGRIFTSLFGGKVKSYLYVIEERSDLPGAKIKIQNYDGLLWILDPIVRRGLNSKDVEAYVEKIYRHVVDTKSSSASSLFTIKYLPVKDKSASGLYGTATSFAKAVGHEAIREVLEGAMALHHLFAYLSSNNLNIFDLDSKIFMGQEFIHRFSTVEEAIDLFIYTHALMERSEDADTAKACEKNKLPLNDNVISSIGTVESLTTAIAFVDISGSMGDLSSSGCGRKERVKNETNSILLEFDEVVGEVDKSLRVLAELKAEVKISKTSLFVYTSRFIENLSKQMDMVSALDIDIFKRAGIKAELACIKNQTTGYFEVPQKSFEHYCAGNASVVLLSNSLRSQDLNDKDTILEVYRVCSFFVSMRGLFRAASDDLTKNILKFDTDKKIPMGIFDAYYFVSRHHLLCSIRSMDEIEAIKRVTKVMGTELFITNRVRTGEIYKQLVRMYRFFLSFFKTTLGRLEKMMDTYYVEFANKLGGGYSLAGDEAFFKGAREAVLLENYMSTGVNFSAFARRCTRTLDGFLKKDGELVSNVVDGNKMFLSERGVWVGMRGGKYITEFAADNFFRRI